MSIPEEDLERFIEEQRKEGKEVVKRGDTLLTLQNTLSESLDYGNLIRQQIQNCCFAMMYGEEAFGRAVSVLYAMVPEQDKDELFNEEVGKAKIVVYERGTGRYSLATGMEIKVPVLQPNYPQLFQCLINLFRRKGLLWQETRQEVF